MFKTIKKLLPDNIIELSSIQVFQNNSPIIKTNQQLDYLYYILEGRAKIYQYTDNGKLILIHFLYENDWIGELTFLGVESETKNVVAIGETTVLAIPKSIVTNQLLKDHFFLLEMSRFIGNKLLVRTQHMVKNQGYELKYRLATLIIDLSHNGIYSEKHINIVDYLGTSYRHLLKMIKDFQDEELIEKIAPTTYSINIEQLKKYYIF